MGPLTLAALVVGVAATVGLALGLPDSWFFGLLSLAALLGALNEAYDENKASAVGFIGAAALFSVFSLRAAFLDRRDTHAGPGAPK
ncbi:hypothetical protein [Streptomyces umbrinus]|uniref:hypothetical protein n=1 Tax=Streptomyces umbrinus TaxID=67370 RepID=UPI00341D3B63